MCPRLLAQPGTTRSRTKGCGKQAKTVATRQAKKWKRHTDNEGRDKNTKLNQGGGTDDHDIYEEEDRSNTTTATKQEPAEGSCTLQEQYNNEFINGGKVMESDCGKVCSVTNICYFIIGGEGA